MSLKKPHPLGNCLRTIAATLAAFASAHGAPPATTPNEIIELPKFYVTDVRVMPDQESWRYASLPGVEVLSNDWDRDTKRIVQDLYEFRQVLDIVAPIPDRARLPLKLILCGAKSKFEEFLPPAAKRGVPRVSYLLQDEKAAVIVVDSQTTNLVAVANSGEDDPGTDPAWQMPIPSLSTPAPAFIPDSFGSDLAGMPDLCPTCPGIEVHPSRMLQSEYVRMLLRQSQPPVPLWFEEGFTQIMTEIRFERRFIEIGRVNPVNIEGASEPQFNKALSERSFMPFDELFAFNRSPENPVNTFGDIMWRKQAYGFVHLCMFGRGGKFKPALMKLVDRGSREPITEAVFKECFGMSYKQIAAELRDYIDFTDHTLIQFLGKNGGPLLKEPPQIELRDATDAEIGRIKGQALALAGRVEQARAEYIASYIRGERDPQLLAGLGLFEAKSGKPERALKFLKAAVAVNTADPEAYTELARLQLADGIAASAGPQGKLSEQQALDTTALLMKAHSLPPMRTDTYELLADVLARSEIKPTGEQVTALIQGAVRFPGRMKIVFAAATFSLDTGLAKEARALVEHGSKYAPDDKTRSHFAQLRTALPKEQ